MLYVELTFSLFILLDNICKDSLEQKARPSFPINFWTYLRSLEATLNVWIIFQISKYRSLETSQALFPAEQHSEN